MKQDWRKRTKSFALRIIPLYSPLPKLTEVQVIGKQVLRSVTPVGAPYRELTAVAPTLNLLARLRVDCKNLKKLSTGYNY